MTAPLISTALLFKLCFAHAGNKWTSDRKSLSPTPVHQFSKLRAPRGRTRRSAAGAAVVVVVVVHDGRAGRGVQRESRRSRSGEYRCVSLLALCCPQTMPQLCVCTARLCAARLWQPPLYTGTREGLHARMHACTHADACSCCHTAPLRMGARTCTRKRARERTPTNARTHARSRPLLARSQAVFKRSTTYVPFLLVGSYFTNEVRARACARVCTAACRPPPLRLGQQRGPPTACSHVWRSPALRVCACDLSP